MPEPYTVIGYYTDDTYKAHAAKLAASMAALGLPRPDIRPAPCLGSWQANTQAKARYIKAALQRAAPSTGVLYVDVDAEFRSAPTLIGLLPHDVAAVYWQPAPEAKPALYSGTLHFRRTPAALLALERWIAMNAAHPYVLDQATLEAALACTPEARVYALPAAYCWIENTMRPWQPATTPIIYHHHVSAK